MFYRYPSLTLAIAILTGCSTNSNYYDSTANPFDEPVLHNERPRVDPGAALPAQVKRQSSLPPVVPKSLPADQAVTFAAPDNPLKVADVSPQVPDAPPQAQEMIEEANRIGALGDIQGKADLLSQAGYSGSPRAFYDLARMYLDGSLPNDMTIAVKYITMAHESGYVEATRVLGMLYLRGQGVTADENYGRKLMELASKTSARAAREYGQLLTNEYQPHLNDPDLGIQYLRDASERGDSDASLSLTKQLVRLGRVDQVRQSNAQASVPLQGTLQSQQPGSDLKGRALRGDTSAMVGYSQQLMLRKTPDTEPEFTAYCWLSVAKKLGSRDAANELGLMSGIRAVSDRQDPGRLDQCIQNLHDQVVEHG